MGKRKRRHHEEALDDATLTEQHGGIVRLEQPHPLHRFALVEDGTVWMSLYWGPEWQPWERSNTHSFDRLVRVYAAIEAKRAALVTAWVVYHCGTLGAA